MEMEGRKGHLAASSEEAVVCGKIRRPLHQFFSAFFLDVHRSFHFAIRDSPVQFPTVE